MPKGEAPMTSFRNGTYAALVAVPIAKEGSETHLAGGCTSLRGMGRYPSQPQSCPASPYSRPALSPAGSTSPFALAVAIRNQSAGVPRMALRAGA